MTVASKPGDTTAVTPPAEIDINEFMSNMVNNPSLPQAGVVRPVAQKIGADEIINSNSADNYAPAKTAATQMADVAPVQAAQGTASTISDSTKIEQAKANAEGQATYEAATLGVNNIPTITAAMGQVSELATVQGQMERLMDFDPETGTPAWASGAQRTAEELMASRGMGSSSIAGRAIVNAIMEAGIPIAQQDAQTYAQMDFKNLDNEQQVILERGRMQHQNLLSDNAAINASRQFNATSRTQVATFFAGLTADIDKFNVTQLNAMNEANAGRQQEANLTNTQIAQRKAEVDAAAINAADKFNAEREQAWNQFTAGQQLVIDQSNAAWRRTVNTQNTAAENAANQINATNALNISNTALNNLWQAARDEASWVNDATQAAEDRKHNLAIAAFNRDTSFQLADSANSGALWTAIGEFAVDIFKASND
jgi:hypothetical protein